MKMKKQPATKLPTLTVGQTVWLFDVNRRRYREPEPGRLYPAGGPIYAEHWTEVQVASVAPRGGSVELSNGRRLRRDEGGVFCGGSGRIRLAVTRAEVDADIYINTHRHGICDAVRACGDAAILRQIAALVGYEEKGERG